MITIDTDGTVSNTHGVIGHVHHELDGAWTVDPAEGPASFEYPSRAAAVHALVKIAYNADGSPKCNTLCVTAYDAGCEDKETMPAGTIIKAHPSCPVHGTGPQDDPHRVGETYEYVGPAADEDMQMCPVCHHPSCEGFYYADPSCGARD